MTTLKVAGGDPAANALRPDAPPRLLYLLAPGHPRTGLADRLGRFGYAPVMAHDAAHALRVLVEQPIVACLVDLAGDRAALTAIRLIRARHKALPLVGLVDAVTPMAAADALRQGVIDLLAWPFDDHELATVLADARDRTPTLVSDGRSDGLVAQSPVMRELMVRVREIALTGHPVALCGADGTGKRLVARALHDASSSPAGPFVSVDCTERPPSTVEREIFGDAGSDAGEPRDRGTEAVSADSAVARARGGTLFLRNLDEVAARVQGRLAALLRNREVFLRETSRAADLDARIVAAFRSPLETLVSEQRLRGELAARFTMQVDLPTLRQRREDIALLAVGILKGVSAPDRETKSLSRAALELLSALPWPGNVPELEQAVHALVARTRRPVIQLEDVLEQIGLDGMPQMTPGMTLRDAREQFERECIASVLARHHGRVGEAARALGIQRTNLYRKVRQLGIPRHLLSSYR